MKDSAGDTRRLEAKAPGRLSKTLLRLLMKHATIIESEPLSDRVRLITLEGADLKHNKWTPGDKVQIAMGTAFVARTYTPIDWDQDAGRMRILGYAHGEGPGSAWVMNAGAGVECDVFGPRASVDVSGVGGPLALFGDETSIGLAHSLVCQQPERAVACCFEVGDLASAGSVLARLGLAEAALFERRGDDGHLDRMEAMLPDLSAAGASFVLTGRAAMIQRLRQQLKNHSVPPNRIFTKAYWAAGKTGLD